MKMNIDLFSLPKYMQLIFMFYFTLKILIFLYFSQTYFHTFWAMHCYAYVNNQAKPWTGGSVGWALPHTRKGHDSQSVHSR